MFSRVNCSLKNIATRAIGLGLGLGAFAVSSHATIVVVDFDSLPTGPSTYVEAGPEQTLVFPGAATFSGGVVLGNATNFPGIRFATGPNTYASSDPLTDGGGSDTLLSTLTIDVDPSFAVSEVSFALFNGLTTPISYTATAYDGSNVVGSQTLTDVPSNLDSGFGLIDLLAPNITQVKISPTNPGGWDFLIDTVAFNEPVTSAVPSVPEPASLAALGVGAVALIRRRRKAA